MRAAAGWMIALASVAAGTARADDKTIVVPAEAATGKVDAAVLGAAARGVKQAAPAATVADASLADSAFILGCDPAADACRDEVAGQLGYQRLVIVSRRDRQVEVVVRERGGASQRKSFVVTGEGDQAGLATVERDVATMLGAGGASGGGGGDGGAGGGGGGGGATSGDAGRVGGMPRGAVIVGIGGGALLLGGFVMWGLAAAKQGEIDDAPTNTAADLEHLAALESDGRSYASIGNGLVIGGGVAVVAAGAWILLTRNRERSSMQVAPVVAPGTATIQLEATW
ncbi:MAG: hypothetical protein JNK64_40195 [Myxococcales bacterium]|nr:hypothetical protein [Myxococcales bacterium]